MLTDTQKERYDRNIRLYSFGEAGQEKLLASSVLVIGAGGLGSPAILYLAAAGVGNLTIIDKDTVDVSNLQRQVIHTCADINRFKAISAKEKVEAINKDIRVTAITEEADATNLRQLISSHDFTVECTDSSKIKFLVNDICVKLNKAYSHAGVTGMAGQAMTYLPGHACLRCAFDEPNQSTALTSRDIGILGAAAGILGSMQAGEAVKYLTGYGESLIDAYLYLNFASSDWKKIEVKRDKHCPACGK